MATAPLYTHITAYNFKALGIVERLLNIHTKPQPNIGTFGLAVVQNITLRWLALMQDEFRWCECDTTCYSNSYMIWPVDYFKLSSQYFSSISLRFLSTCRPEDGISCKLQRIADTNKLLHTKSC
jgi:hypothetical protein